MNHATTDANTGSITDGWRRVLHAMGGDLPADEWAYRIGCTVQEVTAELRHVRTTPSALEAQNRELRESVAVLRSLLEDRNAA